MVLRDLCIRPGKQRGARCTSPNDGSQEALSAFSCSEEDQKIMIREDVVALEASCMRSVPLVIHSSGYNGVLMTGLRHKAVSA